MAFDYKKEFREFYLPPAKPQIVNVPQMQFVAVRGKGNPNEEAGEYKSALNILYAVSYTLKMSKMGDHHIDGYYDFVVPPLEGFWWQNGINGIDYSHKEKLEWISLIRLPDFVSKQDFDWAKETAQKKKGLDTSCAELFKYAEGKCVQIMHLGSYDAEPASIKLMDDFAAASGYETDFSESRFHHEIYLSDPRKVAPEKLKTVIRHPIKAISTK
ncbi:MAG: GyrI-like domain-containing protein [Spirochaetaceae bacterium]|nr:GyrI-like domain-containing protein [Spirochaetaceae bacterium]